MQHLMALLYLLMARPRWTYSGVLHSLLAPTAALVQLGLDRDAPQPGENRVTEGTREPQEWGYASDESSGASGCSIPVSLHGTGASRAFWPELSTLYSTGMAQLGPGSKHQDHTKGWLVRRSSSTLTQHVHKSSRYRMPLWSTFRARYLAGSNQHNCSGICGVKQI